MIQDTMHNKRQVNSCAATQGDISLSGSRHNICTKWQGGGGNHVRGYSCPTKDGSQKNVKDMGDRAKVEHCGKGWIWGHAGSSRSAFKNTGGLREETEPWGRSQEVGEFHREGQKSREAALRTVGGIQPWGLREEGASSYAVCSEAVCR